MNQPEDSGHPQSSLSAGDVLPPVQPPAASFIVQLFLIPLLIVSIIVAVWLMFSWLARSGNDPQELVDNIERVNHASWQQALSLAQLLRDPRQADLRNDRELAQRLADLLSKQVAEGRDDKDHQSLRMYLCRALGEFEIDAGCDALAEAAVHEDRAEDADTRRAALQALGMLSGRIDSAQILKHETVLPAVLRGTEEFAEEGAEKTRRELLRSTATYVLGLLPSPTSVDRLAELIHDPSLDVGYNAAIGLARQGDARAIPILVEMLNPPDDALIDPNPLLNEEQQSGQKDWKRAHVVSNALRATGKLSTDHPDVDISELIPAIEQLANDPQKAKVLRIQAAEVLRLVRPARR